MNFWDEYSWEVKKYVLVPFIIYFCSTITYFSVDLINEDFRAQDHNFDDWLSLEFFNRVVTIVFMFYFALWEGVQIKRNGFKYFLDLYNYLDIGSIILNTFLLCDLFLRPKDKKWLTHEQTVLAAFVSVLILWWKIIYWFRLFTATSFYIKLISETIGGIVYFTIIFAFIMSAFANCIFILDNNREEGSRSVDGSGSKMLDGNFANRVADSLLNQYMLALGEFSLDNFSAETPNSEIVWLIFIAATFVSQITILNMLIAVMGDTFDAVVEKREQYAMKEKIRILNDFVSLVEWFEK